MAQTELFLRFMQRQGLNITQQRLRIADVFFALPGHHTLEEIYQVLQKEEKDIGQTTVYRTLKLLCEAKLANELQFGDGVARFEAVMGPHHDHLLCRLCGKTVEFHDEKIEERQKEVGKSYGFKVLEHSHILYGLCGECQIKN